MRGYPIIGKEDKIMEYVKPAVINPMVVNSAKCGDGPCGRPCSVNKA